jgi:hypothetical protein
MEAMSELEDLTLVIREPFGQLCLILRGGMLSVEPDKAFRHRVAERMTDANTELRSHNAILDGEVARVRSKSSSESGSLWGEFAVADCDVELSDARLCLRIARRTTTFLSPSFHMQDAERFVRQFNKARAHS